MSFMEPQAEYLSTEEAREYLEDPEAEEGFYGRLSASGYLDCTDWSGPFPKAWMAMRYICELYEVDTEGEART